MRSNDLEPSLRRAAAELPSPSEAVTASTLQTVLAARVRARTRQTRNKWLLALVAAAALALAFGLGALVVTSRTEAAPAAKAAGPGFLPADGWDTLATGVTAPPQAPVAIAANVALAEQRLGELPEATVRELGPDGVVIAAIFYPRGESDAVDRQFPDRQQPFFVKEAELEPMWEGQPNPNLPRRRIMGHVNGYNVEVSIYFGSRNPPEALVHDTDQTLARLVIPVARK